MSKDRLTPLEFGKRLITTGDLDPVYIVLWNAQLEPLLLKKWLLSYLCFYHCGTASWIADQADYWKAMGQAAASKEWPRSSERRHFRGQTAIKSVAWLRERGVSSLFLPLTTRPVLSAAEVIRYVKTWYGFGDWVAFKAADIVDRIGMTKVEFGFDDAMYDSPTKAACKLWEEAGLGRSDGRVPECCIWAVKLILKHLGHYEAPPRGDRLINIQEVETILCKYGSYCKGKYHLGEDITAVRTGLMRFARNRTSQRLLAAGREGGLW